MSISHIWITDRDDTRQVHPAVDRAVVALLRSPIHRLADSKLCELRYHGPKSGRPVSLPVMYAPWGNAVVVLVGDAEHKQWWRAFRTAHDVDVCAGRNSTRGIGRALAPGDSRFDAASAAYERSHGIAAVGTDRIVLIEFSGA